MMIWLRRYFVAGLLVWLPLVATYVVLSFAIRLIDRSLLLLPHSLRPETLIGFQIPGLGVILTLALVIVTGLIVANFFGRRLISAWESVLARIPLVRTVYGAVKQITASLFADASQSFREVVLVEYPRRGLWMLAFVTGDTPKKFQQVVGKDLINIYVPTTPNPTSGFYIMVPPSEVMRLNVPVEVGLKMILSAGVVNPLDDPVEAKKMADELQRTKAKQAAKAKREKNESTT
ncbi:DUF502 domain-containing protein [Arenicella xantha]|uniref:Putative membrane protein n=1 Tax=Arenicella xantha TaxID=644221 RepID=A0A395JPH1_9GAMM|nr:DUF502 domain-containing protein [Arenicella xantha]RBP53243.1 putative membrane protein [Arenicella xantha]